MVDVADVATSSFIDDVVTGWMMWPTFCVNEDHLQRTDS